MLPDTLHQLPRTERFAYAKLLAVMARANDELTVEEMETFEQRLGTALLSPEQRNQIRAYLKSPPTLEECLTGLGHEAGRLAVRDSVMMAAADGNVDKKEKKLLKKIANYFDMQDDAIDRLLEWTAEGYAWMQSGVELLNELSK